VAKFHRHLFVCVNDRGAGHPRGSCAEKGGADVAEAFKVAIHERGLKRVLRANKAGCLDQCAQGVTVVVYPEAVWYGGVTRADVDEIVDEHLLGGRPVERLRIPDERLTGKPLPMTGVSESAPDPGGEARDS